MITSLALWGEIERGVSTLQSAACNLDLVARLPPTVDKTQKDMLLALFGWFLDPVLWYLRKDCRSPVPTTERQG